MTQLNPNLILYREFRLKVNFFVSFQFRLPKSGVFRATVATGSFLNCIGKPVTFGRSTRKSANTSAGSATSPSSKSPGSISFYFIDTLFYFWWDFLILLLLNPKSQNFFWNRTFAVHCSFWINLGLPNLHFYQVESTMWIIYDEWWTKKCTFLLTVKGWLSNFFP